MAKVVSQSTEADELENGNKKKTILKMNEIKSIILFLFKKVQWNKNKLILKNNSFVIK